MAVASEDVKTPSGENMQAFRIPPGVYIKLHCGTWHAGPLFDSPGNKDISFCFPSRNRKQIGVALVDC